MWIKQKPQNVYLLNCEIYEDDFKAWRTNNIKPTIWNLLLKDLPEIQQNLFKNILLISAFESNTDVYIQLQTIVTVLQPLEEGWIWFNTKTETSTFIIVNFFLNTCDMMLGNPIAGKLDIRKAKIPCRHCEVQSTKLQSQINIIDNQISKETYIAYTNIAENSKFKKDKEYIYNQGGYIPIQTPLIHLKTLKIPQMVINTYMYL